MTTGPLSMEAVGGNFGTMLSIRLEAGVSRTPMSSVLLATIGLGAWACSGEGPQPAGLEGPSGGFSVVSIDYSCGTLAGRQWVKCRLDRQASGTFVASACGACSFSRWKSETGQWDCDGGQVDASGAEVPAGTIAALTEVNGLGTVAAKTACMDHTDNYPSYEIKLEAANSPAVIVTGGGNCGPYFVAQGTTIWCDCGQGIYAAIWDLIHALAPGVSPTFYGHAPSKRCSCDKDYNM